VRELGADRFAVVEHGRVGGAFARVVHLEHGLPTTVVGVADASALAAACAEAESTSSFAEVRFDRRGERCVPLLRPLELEPGGRPLARGDLLLVSGGGKGIVAECALLLARRHGVRLLVLGRSDPAADAELAANLRRFAAAGVDARYVRADVCDAAAVRAAVGGARVRAVLHGAGVNAPALLPQIDVEALRATIAPKVDGLANILAAVDGAQLRLVVTFGSIIGAMGLRGEAHYAVANDWLRAAVEDLAAASPQCRCLDVAWSVWAGAGMGERLGTVDALARAGVDAIPLDEGTELLDALLCDAAVSGSVVAAGRFGLPPTLELAPAARPLLRFPEETALEYPGIELVADARVGSGSDPYVEEHVLDGVRLLPAVIGLEAMAQAAASVAGAPPATLTEVAFERAVTIPPDGARLVRTAALARRDSVRVVLRSDESALQVDHFRATCHRAAAPGGTIALDDGAVELAPAEVYDRLLFHSGRFRRLVRYRVLTAHRCVAELAARDEPWFGAFQPGRLLLGDPGVHDALLHVLQACIPGERVLPVAADRIEIVRPPAGDRTVVVSGRERGEDGAALVWDVDLAELDGTVLERWRGLRLLRIGTPIRPEQWPLPLLVPYLERRVGELTGSRLELVVAPRSAGEAADARIAAAAHVGRDAIVRRANGRPEAAGLPVSAAHAAGLTLAVAGEGGVLACDVERVVDRDVPMWRDLLGRARFDLAATLSGEVDEALDATATRVWAAGECVEKAGASRGGPLTIGACADDGWVLLQSGGAPIATYAGRVEGVDRPLAFAFLTRSGR
jgi:enediyne polyketide synthase